MKKIPILLTILLVSSTAFAADLTNEEYSTVEKLHNTGIMTKQRTVQEWHNPIRSIDAASAVIKATSKLKQYTDETKSNLKKETIRDLDGVMYNVDRNDDRLDVQELRLDSIDNRIDKNIKRHDDQGIINILLTIGIIAAAII